MPVGVVSVGPAREQSLSARLDEPTRTAHEGPRRRAAAGASTRSPGGWRGTRRWTGCSRRRATPASREAECVPVATDDVPGSCDSSSGSASTSRSSVRRRRSSPGSPTSSRRGGTPSSGPTRAAARIEGSKAWAKDAHASARDPGRAFADVRRDGRRRSSRPRASSARRTSSRPTGSPPARASWSPTDRGRAVAARRGGARATARSATPGRRSWSRSSSGPRGLGVRAHRRPRRPAARARAGLQARRRRRRGSEHRRHGRVLAGAVRRRRDRRPDPRRDPRADGPGDGGRGRAVPRRPVRGADADRRRAEGARVQLPGSATPRRRCCCRGSGPTSRELCLACAEGDLAALQGEPRPTRPASRSSLASGGYPGALRDRGPRSRGSRRPSRSRARSCSTPGTAERQGRVVTSGGRVLSVGALGDDARRGARPGVRGLRPVSFEGMHTGRTSRRWARGGGADRERTGTAGRRAGRPRPPSSPVMQQATAILEKLEIPHEVRVMSPPGTPTWSTSTRGRRSSAG